MASAAEQANVSALDQYRGSTQQGEHLLIENLLIESRHAIAESR